MQVQFYPLWKLYPLWTYKMWSLYAGGLYMQVVFIYRWSLQEVGLYMHHSAS